MRKTLLLPLAAVAFVAACDSEKHDVTAVAAPSTQPAVVSGHGNYGNSPIYQRYLQKYVVDGAIYLQSPYNPSVTDSYAFSAFKRTSTSGVSGSFFYSTYLVLYARAAIATGRIICAQVTADGRARIGGVVTYSTDRLSPLNTGGLPAGQYVVWSVSDNGESRPGDEPDTGSPLLGVPDAAAAQAYCALGGPYLESPGGRGSFIRINENPS